MQLVIGNICSFRESFEAKTLRFRNQAPTFNIFNIGQKWVNQYSEKSGEQTLIFIF